MGHATEREIVNDRGAVVTYVDELLDAHERGLLFVELDAARDRFDHDHALVFGRRVPSPRLVCAFGDTGLRYRYSGVDREAHPWLPQLREARDRIATLIDQELSYALVNLYRDGHDRLGWHSDGEADIVQGSTIASLSLGAVRPFQLRRREKRSPIHEVLLGDGSLLLMKGATQRLYKHQLPARARIEGVRFNVTFRQMRREPERS